MVSGDRGGTMAMWDINTGQCVKQMPNAHQGSVSKIHFYSDGQQNNLILSAGLKDGQIKAHDMRSHQPISSQRVHQGAINMLDSTD